jgi:hypothetical protein
MTRKPRNPRRASSDHDDPPTIREIRAVRRKLLRQAGGTVEGYFRLMAKMSASARPAPSTKAGKSRGKAA